MSRDSLHQLNVEVRQLRALLPPEGEDPRTPGKCKQEEVPFQVFCRFRGQFENENSRGGTTAWELTDDTAGSSHVNASFTFDHVFGPSATQKEVFERVEPMALNVLRGTNSSILCYGQTSAGKTYTMEGETTGQLQGLIPRALHSIFKQAKERGGSRVATSFRISMLEIYQERLRDLLVPTNSADLRIVEDRVKGVWMKGLSEITVTDPETALRVFNSGRAHRQIAATGQNDHSSRSHSVFILTVEQQSVEDFSSTHGKLYLVDLAGSENVKRSCLVGEGKAAANAEILEEAKAINQSLSTLGLVINRLADWHKSSAKDAGDFRSHIPYRNSKLTRVLQDSLGGNSHTTLVINCSISSQHVMETLSTLRFGARARSVVNCVTHNQNNHFTSLCRVLHRARQEISRLQQDKDEATQASDSQRPVGRRSIPGLATQIVRKSLGNGESPSLLKPPRVGVRRNDGWPSPTTPSPGKFSGNLSASCTPADMGAGPLRSPNRGRSPPCLPVIDYNSANRRSVSRKSQGRLSDASQAPSLLALSDLEDSAPGTPSPLIISPRSDPGGAHVGPRSWDDWESQWGNYRQTIATADSLLPRRFGTWPFTSTAKRMYAIKQGEKLTRSPRRKTLPAKWNDGDPSKDDVNASRVSIASRVSVASLKSVHDLEEFPEVDAGMAIDIKGSVSAVTGFCFWEMPLTQEEKKRRVMDLWERECLSLTDAVNSLEEKRRQLINDNVQLHAEIEERGRHMSWQEYQKSASYQSDSAAGPCAAAIPDLPNCDVLQPPNEELTKLRKEVISLKERLVNSEDANRILKDQASATAAKDDMGWLAQVNTQGEQIKALETSLEAKTTELENEKARTTEAHDSLSTKMKENAALNAKVRELETMSDAAFTLQAEVDECNSNISKLEEQLRTSKENEQSLRQSTSKMEEEASKIDQKIQEHVDAQTDLKNELRAQTMRATQAEERATKELKKSQEREESLRQSLKQMEETTQKSSQQMQQQASEQEELKKALESQSQGSKAAEENLKTSLSKSQQETQELAQKLEEQRSEQEKLQKALELQTKLVEEGKAKEADALKTSDETEQSLRSSLSKMEQEAKDASEVLKTHVSEQQELEKALQVQKLLLAEARTTGDKDLQTRQEAEENLRMTLVKKEVEAQQATEQLKVQAEAHEELKRTLDAQSKLAAESNARSAEESNKQSEMLRSLEDRLSAKDADIAHEKARVSEVTSQVDCYKSRVDEAAVQVQGLESQLSLKDAEVNSQAERIKCLESGLSANETQAAQDKILMKSLEDQLAASCLQIAEEKGLADGRGERIESLLKEHEAFENQLSIGESLRVSLVNSEAAEQKAAQRVRDLEADTESRIMEMSDQNSSLKVRISVSDNVAKEREEQMLATQSKLQLVESELHAKDQQVLSLEASLRDVEASKFQSLNERIRALEAEVQERDGQIHDLHLKSLADDLQVVPQETALVAVDTRPQRGWLSCIVWRLSLMLLLALARLAWPLIASTLEQQFDLSIDEYTSAFMKMGFVQPPGPTGDEVRAATYMSLPKGWTRRKPEGNSTNKFVLEDDELQLPGAHSVEVEDLGEFYQSSTAKIEDNTLYRELHVKGNAPASTGAGVAESVEKLSKETMQPVGAPKNVAEAHPQATADVAHTVAESIQEVAPESETSLVTVTDSSSQAIELVKDTTGEVATWFSRHKQTVQRTVATGGICTVASLVYYATAYLV